MPRRLDSALPQSFFPWCLSASQVGTLLAALRRYITLVRTLGGDLPDPTSHFSVLWFLHRSWALAIPCEFRTPVPHSVALAVAVTSWLLAWPVLSFLTLLSFHCLLRPAEARSLRWCDLHCFTEDEQCRYPGVYGLIGIRLQKHGGCPATPRTNTSWWSPRAWGG